MRTPGRRSSPISGGARRRLATCRGSAACSRRPPTRRDLFDRRRYLCPNSIVVSRGCPHHCDFCYKDAFYEGGISFYTQAVDAALAEIERMPGRHVYFLDDHLLGNPRFAAALFEGMRGMGRVFQGASTVDAILRSDLIERAAEAGMRSVFVGLETINPENLRLHAKRQNLSRDYDEVIRRVHGLGMMINASFVFGLDDDGPDVFDRTVDWGVARSLETATFHIMTPYPGTALHARVEAEDRITDRDWDHYDTRHVVYRPRGMAPDVLLAGYRRAYRDFYRWGSILRGAGGQPSASQALRHLAYAGGWKKFEPLWDLVIRARRVDRMLPLLEGTLDAYGRARRRSLDRTLDVVVDAGLMEAAARAALVDGDPGLGWQLDTAPADRVELEDRPDTVVGDGAVLQDDAAALAEEQLEEGQQDVRAAPAELRPRRLAEAAVGLERRGDPGRHRRPRARPGTPRPRLTPWPTGRATEAAVGRRAGRAAATGCGRSGPRRSGARRRAPPRRRPAARTTARPASGRARTRRRRGSRRT